MYIVRLCLFLSQASLDVLLLAFISSPLNSCKAMLSGLPKRAFMVHNYCKARVPTSTKSTLHQKLLHWFPVSFRIVLRFLFFLFVLRVFGGFLLTWLLSYQPSQTLRSFEFYYKVIQKRVSRQHPNMASDWEAVCQRTSVLHKLLMFLKGQKPMFSFDFYWLF